MPKCSSHCNKKNCIFFRKAEIPAVVANDDITPPQNGDFCNMLVVYEATGNAYLFASDGIPTLLSSNDYRKLSNLPSINGVTIIGDLTLSDIGVTQLVEEEADARRDADNGLQEQIDTIAASSDVVDIVGTYQELMQYDTSHLTINDVIKVLDDETENDATTYYRWTNDGWLFIGQEGPYYTKSQVNELLDGKLDNDALDDYYDKAETDALLADKADVSDLAAKQDKLIAGTNITIDQATNTISATVPSLDNYYTKQETYSQTEVNNLISGVEADIPTATSQLTNDSGFLTTLPIATSQILGGIKVGSGLSVASDGTLSADAQHIDVDTALSTTSTNPVENRVITNALNNKANLSDIPTVPTNVSAFYNDAGYVTSSTIAQNYYNKTETYTQTEVDNLISGVSADIPTKTSDLTNDGATGTSTYVELNQLAPVATSGSYNDLTDKPSITPELVEMSYGESNAWAKFIAAYNAHCIVYCRASSAANPASGSQTRKAFMAYVNNATNPTQVEFQYYRSVSSHTNAQQGDQVFIYLLTSANGGTWSVTTRNAFSKVVAGSNMTSTYSNGTITLNATQPTVPTKTSDLTNDGSDGTSTYVEADQLATVATSGSYNDLSNKPTIPAAQVNSDWDATSGVAQILNKPTLATVATSGSYNDLTNKPTIPTVNNATLTIQKNGTTVKTFTANASSNVTANITVPTKTSDLTNDGADGGSPYVTEADIAPAELGGEGNAIHIEGTTDCSAIDTQIGGSIEQDGTPTPSAPVPVQTVTGRQTVTVAGKNILDYVTYFRSGTYNGITATLNDDGSITISGKPTSNYVQIATVHDITDTLEDGATYSLSSDGHDRRFIGQLQRRPKDGSGTQYIDTITGNKTVTIDKANNNYYIGIMTVTTTDWGNDPLTITRTFQFEKGAVTSFEPYKAQNYEINLGKNLIEPRMPTTTYHGVTCTNNGDGSFTLNGTATATATWRISQSTANGHDNMLNLNGTYTLSCSGLQNGVHLIVTQFNVWQTVGAMRGNDTPATFTTNLNDLIVYVAVTNGTTVNNVTIYPQLEKGSTASSYSPYFTPIELCKIGTHQDRIYKQNGKWYLHKEVGHYDITGAEDWTRSGRTTSTVFAGVLANDTLTTLMQIGANECFINRFIYKGANVEAGGYDVYNYSSAGVVRAFVLYVSADSASDITAFKTWLTNNPTAVYYSLATPTTTEITNPETLRGLAELDDAHGYESITNVTVSTPNTVPALLSVSTYAGGAIPAATNNRPGVVMIGDGLGVDECGKISVRQPMSFTMQYEAGTHSEPLPGWRDDGLSELVVGPGVSPKIYKTSLVYEPGYSLASVSFINDKTGEQISSGDLYTILLGGADVVLNNVPLGSLWGDGWADAGAHVDGLHLNRFSNIYKTNDTLTPIVGFGGSSAVFALFPGSGTPIQTELSFIITKLEDMTGFIRTQGISIGLL